MHKRILATQTCIVGDADSYHDYRDYIFTLLSSSFLKNEVVRINVERGQEYVPEMQEAAKGTAFADVDITAYKPESWAKYILAQIKQAQTPWTMLFPGDHIYVHADNDYLYRMLDAADKAGVQAISYGHVQDWEYLLDWNRIHLVENTDEYVIIEWGWKWRRCRNKKLARDAFQKIGTQIVINPVPGYMIFRSDFLNEILPVIPHSVKWHDVEQINHPLTQSYKILIPKQYMYRHVHGYWLEHYFEVLSGVRERSADTKQTLLDMYIAPKYDWKEHTPSPSDYLMRCLERYPYIYRYIEKHEGVSPVDVYSPFAKGVFSKKKSFARSVLNKTLLCIDNGVLLALRLRSVVRRVRR